MADIKLLYGTETKFTKDVSASSDTNGQVYFVTDADNNKAYLYFGDSGKLLNIIPKLLTVPNGGTGLSTLEQGKVLIGNGTSSVELRAITDQGTPTYISANTNLITANTLKNWTGAYDSNNNSNIQYLGTIYKGAWRASTIDVAHGGTGVGQTEDSDGFTQYGILYGNGLDPLQVTAAGADGQIFSTEAGTPKFLTPTISWISATSDTTGPLVEFKLSGQSYSSPIPAASGGTDTTAATAGIVTYGTQSFAGEKTFKGTVLTSNIYPIANNTYTSGTPSSTWNTVYSVNYDIRDVNKIQVGRFASTTTGTTNATGVTSLYIGNNKAKDTAGNSRGYVYIYSNNTGYSKFKKEDNSTDESTVTIPNIEGYMLISATEDVNYSSEKISGIPFYTHQGNTNYKYKQVSTNDGINLISLQGTQDIIGYSILALGNSIAGGAAGNKYGGIRLYSTTSTYNDIIANPETSTASIRLPAITKSAELIYHNPDEAIGSSTQAIYIGSDGKPAAVTTMEVSYGGTGVSGPNGFTSNGVLYGNGIGAIQTTSVGEQGTILSPRNDNVPSFTSPEWNWTDGTEAGPTLTLTLHSKGWTTPAIPVASETTSGVVTNQNQTFAGNKIFTGAVTANSLSTTTTIHAGGALSTNSSLTVNGAATIKGETSLQNNVIIGVPGKEHFSLELHNQTQQDNQSQRANIIAHTTELNIQEDKNINIATPELIIQGFTTDENGNIIPTEVSIEGNSSLNGNLAVSGDSFLSGNLTVNGTSVFSNGPINLKGKTLIGTNDTVWEKLLKNELEEYLYVEGTSTFTELSHFLRDVVIGQAGSEEESTLKIYNPTTIGDYINSDSYHDQTLSIYGSTTIGHSEREQSLLVYGTATISSTSNFQDQVVIGTAKDNDDTTTQLLYVKGDSKITGNTTIGGDTNIVGNTTIGTSSSVKKLTVNGEAIITDNLTVQNNGTIAHSLLVGSDYEGSNPDTFVANTNTTINGTATINNDLAVYGDGKHIYFGDSSANKVIFTYDPTDGDTLTITFLD